MTEFSKLSKYGKRVYLKDSEVTRITGIPVKVLRKHRKLGRGIPYSLIYGRTVRYKIHDVIDYMNSQIQKCKIENSSLKADVAECRVGH